MMAIVDLGQSCSPKFPTRWRGQDRGRRGCPVVARRRVSVRAWWSRRRGGPGAAAGQRDPQAGCEFLRGGARPPTAQVVAFIDAHCDDVVEGARLGVETICRVL